MANEQRGEVDLVVGDEVYTLALTMQAIGEMEARTRRPYGAIVRALTGADVQLLREAVWAALKRHHAPAVRRVEDAGALIDGAGGIDAALEALERLFKANQRGVSEEPEAEAGKAEPKRPDDDAIQWRELFVAAARAGLSGDQFWSSTLKELEFSAAARREIAKREHDQLVEIAWMNALLTRTSKFPKLSALVSGAENRQARKQTWQEMKAALRGMTES
jgi:hypothetical protein